MADCYYMSLPGVWVDRLAWMERAMTLAIGKPKKRVRWKKGEREDDGRFCSQEEAKP